MFLSLSFSLFSTLSKKKEINKIFLKSDIQAIYISKTKLVMIIKSNRVEMSGQYA